MYNKNCFYLPSGRFFVVKIFKNVKIFPKPLDKSIFLRLYYNCTNSGSTVGRKENDMLVIDKFSRKPIYEQVVEGIERDIVMGILRDREQLPSIRELSAILGVNPNTIQKAFQELDRNGIIVSGQGRGCFVADHAAERIKEKVSVRITEIEAIAAELARAGIEEEKLLEAIRRAYHDNKK